jgi:hypothetical protein
VDIKTDEYEVITRIMREASSEAIKGTFALGRPITTMQGNTIVRKYSDGRIEDIKDIKKSRIALIKKYNL